MMSSIRYKSLIPGCLLLLLLGGCSISYSGGKSSDSVSAGLDSVSGSLDSLSSISTSFGGSAAELAGAVRLYMEDVSTLTRLYIQDGGTRQSYQQDLTDLAEGYGILAWEAEPATWRAIGIGLHRSGVKGEKLESITFLPPAHHHLIYAGFNS